MTPVFSPLPLPSSANRSQFENIGKEVKGVDLSNMTPDEFNRIENALYEYDLLLFRNVILTPEIQYKLVKAFDPSSEHYGHGNSHIDKAKKSILHPYLKTIPRVPQVQLIGHGLVKNHEGISEAHLKHGHHTSFHKTQVSPEDETTGVTRFFRWHMDAALYDLSPPRVTALYGIKVPKGPAQIVRYDDGTGDELSVSLGTTAFVSGKTMFKLLPLELKSVAVRAKAKYAPHPFEWMRLSRAMPTGLGLETEGLERPFDELPPWTEAKVKIYPFVWKNTFTGDLYLQVHACAITEIYIDPIPEDAAGREGAMFPEGGHLTNLKEVRELVYKMQRPGIAPSLVYPHPWQENDLVLFHNRGLMHSVVGHFTEDQVRVFHQCNLAASDEPVGPDAEDMKKWA